MSSLSSAAARLGCAVVYPKGDWRSRGFDPSSTRGAVDAAFLTNVVADVADRIPVDPFRIYAVGFSSGGFGRADCGDLQTRQRPPVSSDPGA
jgi:poly(3-hydroxybutyrate) depolymerase